MLARFLALLIGAAMAALALYLRDPSIYGPETPGVALGAYEPFRQLLTFCVAGLALCGMMAAFGPGDRSKRRAAVDAAEPAPMANAAAEEITQETTFEPEPDVFRLQTSPTAKPLW